MRPKNLEKEQAIRTVALDIIANEGLENLSMQKLAKAANVSPRTIYIKYENKEDFLVKLFINEVLEPYEQAVLKGFDETMDFAAGVKKIWINIFQYLRNNRPAFAIIQYSRSSPLLNKAYQQQNIRQGQFFAPIHRFIAANIKAGVIKNFPFDVYRAMLFPVLLELVSEYFDYTERPKQIITEKVLLECCAAVIKGMMK
jgi:TetR/AcrR family transcriptional repressor of multidrug resistance operon